MNRLAQNLAAVVAAAGVLMPGLSWAASAAAPKPSCVSADEATAFRLRHLQSRLMVAGLSCGQRDAYNAFVTANMTTLNKYGPNLITYYKRAGGSPALNRYVTDLANAVASIRSEDPVAFCTHTWNVFWELSEKAADLLDVAAANPVPAISQPALCAIPAEKPAPKPAPTAQQAKAP
ncbi:MAG: hypothetical protein JNK21_16315 [Rhodospirillaceae bacterium]|nr:hypothetical protein [Rhodospirillaceae bacterium]